MNKNETEQEVAQKVTLIGSAVDALLGIFKILAASASGSQALMADGIHSLSDLFTDLLVLISFKISRRSPDENHQFGHLRFESLGNLILGFILLLVATGIAFDSVLRDSQSHLTWLGVSSLIITIISKEAIFFYTKKAGDNINSQLLITNAWHSRTDSLSSLIVLLSMGGIYFGYTWLDKAAAIVIALLIAKIAISTIWKTLAELIDTAPNNDTMKSILDCAKSIEPQAIPSNIRARTMAGKVYLDMHLEVDKHISVSEGHYLGELVASKIRNNNPNVSDILIHIDLNDLDQGDQIAKDIAKLPARNQIQADLQFLLRSHRGYVDLQSIKLDYLDTGLEITLIAYAKSLNQALSIEKVGASVEMDCMNIRYAKKINLLWQMKDEKTLDENHIG
jgi:cation diffusion facilitator family transporter